MTTVKLWEQYQHYTRDVTEHGRKLGFAGVAICWIFKQSERPGDLVFSVMIYWAMLTFIGYFMADILQPISGAICLRFFIQGKEKKLFKDTQSIDGYIEKPRWVDYPAFAFFILKCLMLLGGFVFIAFYIHQKLVLRNTP